MTLPAARSLSKFSVLLIAMMMAYVPLSTAAFGADLSDIRPDRVTSTVRLKAIARSDNGRSVGMEATVGRSFLQYRAFKGKLELTPSGKFDVNKMVPARAHRSKAMDKADIYRVDNAHEFVLSNSGKFLGAKGKIPTFVTMLDGPYVDGKRALWICILTSPSVEAFYETALGHERCDAFR